MVVSVTVVLFHGNAFHVDEAGLNRALWPSSHTAEPDAPARVQSNSATPDKKMVPQKAVPRRFCSAESESKIPSI
eukprot:2048655-Amphidinium_carterae.1